jgi:hypothetical protein
MSSRFLRGMIIPMEGGGGPILFQWNPASTTGPTAGANWDQVVTAASEIPFLHFGGGGPSEIRFELVFSRENHGDGFVEGRIEALRRLTVPVTGRGMVRPPLVKLAIGRAIREVCVTREVSPVRGVLAAPRTLAPRDARVAVTFLRWRR